MSWGRLVAEWDRAAAVMTAVRGKEVPNPYRVRMGAAVRTPEQAERESREAWRLLETGLKSMC